MSGPFLLILYGVILAIVYIISIPIRHSVRAKWQAFANQQGLVYQPHDSNNDLALRGNYKNRSIQVFCHGPRKSRGASSVTVKLNDNVSGLNFFTSSGASLFPFLTTGTIPSGDPELDKLCEFGGEPEAQVRKLLASSKIRSYLKYAYFKPIFVELTIRGGFLNVSVPIYPQKPAQLIEYLTHLLQFATVVEYELTAIPAPSISTNPPK